VERKLEVNDNKSAYRCYKCGGFGHMARNCADNKNKNNNEKNNDKLTSENMRGIREEDGRSIKEHPVYIRAQIGKYMMVCLVDTGSEKCVLPGRLIDTTSLEPADCSLFAANGTTINVIGEKTLDVHVSDLTIPTQFVVSSNVTEPMLGVNWLRSNQIIWDLAKDLFIVNGEVFDMILEEKSQELKRRRWLEEKNEINKDERDEKKTKRNKVNETDEVKVINRIWALPMENEINVNKVVCIYRAPFVGDIHPNDIRYPCFVCGPTTKEVFPGQGFG